MAWESPIQRVSSGFLNTVNDSVIANQEGISGLSKFGGQLGKAMWLDATQIAQMYDSAIGTLYGGGYRYVKLKSDSGQPVVGDLLYWDNAAAPGAFQVTLAVNTTTLNYASLAGFYLGGIEPGNYGYIQFAGIASGHYVASLTGTAATGRTVFASVATAGRIDIKDDLATTGGAPLLNNFIGWAVELPVGNGVKQIEIARAFTTRL